jgi:hypothetical protein
MGGKCARQERVGTRVPTLKAKTSNQEYLALQMHRVEGFRIKTEASLDIVRRRTQQHERDGTFTRAEVSIKVGRQEFFAQVVPQRI